MLISCSTTHIDHGNDHDDDDNDDNIDDMHNYYHSTYSQTICCYSADDVLSFTRPSIVWNKATCMEDSVMT